MLTFCDREITSALWKQPGQQYLWAHSNVGPTFQGSVQFVQGGCCWCRNEPRFCFHPPPPPEQIDVTVVVGPNEHDSTLGDAEVSMFPSPILTSLRIVIKAERAIASEALVAQYGRQQDVCGRLWTRTCLAQSA